MTPTWHPYLQNSPYEPLRDIGFKIASSGSGSSYTENGTTLATFTTLTCDSTTLPERVRLMQPTGENYWLFGHGFDDLVTNENWANGWEVHFADQLELYIHAIKNLEPSRSIFLDMGANIGTHALRLAAHGYETHAWEPTHANYVLLHCALAFSNLKAPVRFNHFGLGAQAQSACVESVGNNMGDSVVNVDTTCEAAKRVDIGTLDHYYRSFLRGRKVALIKIDIQGFEFLALDHGRELFDSDDAPPVVIFEWEPYRMTDKGNPADLFRFFERRGYVMFNVNDGAVIESTKMTDAELEALNASVEDVAAIKSEWKEKAEARGYVFNGGSLSKV